MDVMPGRCAGQKDHQMVEYGLGLVCRLRRGPGLKGIAQDFREDRQPKMARHRIWKIGALSAAERRRGDGQVETAILETTLPVTSSALRSERPAASPFNDGRQREAEPGRRKM